MSEHAVVQIVSLIGFLVVTASALASHRLEWSAALRMGLIWASIFIGIALLFAIVAPAG